jgi:hypothetical protein
MGSHTGVPKNRDIGSNSSGNTRSYIALQNVLWTYDSDLKLMPGWHHQMANDKQIEWPGGRSLNLQVRVEMVGEMTLDLVKHSFK